MKSGKVDSAAKVVLKPAPFAAEIDSPQIQDRKLAISELRFAAYAKKGVDELQRVRVSLLEKKWAAEGWEAWAWGFKTFSISPEDLLDFTFEASISEVVGEVSAQTGAAGGEAPNEGVATE